MKLRDLSLLEFENFINNQELATHYQSSNYALLMAEDGYDYDFIGYVDDLNNIIAASMILFKPLKGRLKYGYAPRGFVLDYFNRTLVKEFSDALREHYKKKHVVFIKINPEIAIAQIDTKTHEKTYNWNLEVINTLEENGYYKLKDNLYFEAKFPKYNGIVNLKEMKFENFTKNCKNKIRKTRTKGLKIELAERSGIDVLYPFIRNKKLETDKFYKTYYNVFQKNDMIDLFLVSINTREFLLTANHLYEQESDNNQKLNQLLIKDSSEKNMNKKLNSDKLLLKYKNDVLEATMKNTETDKIYIAGAMVLKFHNRVQILFSGFDKKYQHFNPNYFLHNEILHYYRDTHYFADLNGLTGDFTKNNPYYGLNEFKMGFNPNLYEFIGEFDFVIEPYKYQKFLKLGIISQLFKKKNEKTDSL